MKNILSVLIIAVVLILGSCDPFPTCTESDTLPEYDSLENLEGVEYPNVILTEAALDTFFPRQNIIVTTENQYDIMEQRQNNDGTCTICNFPAIDFNTKTLIGRVVPINCDEQLIMKTTKTGDVYDAYFKLINNSQCDVNVCVALQIFWMAIPKMDVDDTINFHEGKFSYDCEDC